MLIWRHAENLMKIWSKLWNSILKNSGLIFPKNLLSYEKLNRPFSLKFFYMMIELREILCFGFFGVFLKVWLSALLKQSENLYWRSLLPRLIWHFLLVDVAVFKEGGVIKVQPPSSLTNVSDQHLPPLYEWKPSTFLKLLSSLQPLRLFSPASCLP